ncbi:MAG: tripartite tricarboxylate transporter TctB family protein [Hyphomicrobiaceae bacterium]
MKRGWIVATICFLALFGVTIWESTSLPLFDELGPGPGFFPIWLAAIGAALSVLLVMETARGPNDPPGESLIPDRPAIFRVLSVVVMLGVGALLLDLLGWRLMALIVTGALLPALGARSPVAIGLFVLAASFGVFHIFYYWLKVPLPIGTFGI